MHGRIQLRALQPQRERNLARLERLQAQARIDVLLQDRFRPLGCDLFNIHAARGRRHKNRFAFAAVDENAEIEFLLDRERLFNQQPAHNAAFGAGLVRDQRHAQDFAGEFAGFGQRLRDLDAAAFAAAAGMDLGLHDYARCAGVEQFFGRGLSLFARGCHGAARNRDAVLLQDAFCLILMNFHNDSWITLRPDSKPGGTACGFNRRPANR